MAILSLSKKRIGSAMAAMICSITACYSLRAEGGVMKPINE